MDKYMNDKGYKKLPKSSKKVLNDFLEHKDNNKLFEDILVNVDTQKTIKSRQVRLSVFRGILKRVFDMGTKEMKPIEPSVEQKEEYFQSNVQGFKKQKEETITKEMMEDIKDIPLFFLLMTSGRRIDEIITNDVVFENDVIKVKLNKKKKDVFYPIKTLICPKKWYEMYLQTTNELADKYKNKDTIINNFNKKMRGIIPQGFYKRSSHICRAIYVRYIYQFLREGGETLANVIHTHLNHDTLKSVGYYQHVILNDDLKGFFNPECHCKDTKPPPIPDIDYEHIDVEEEVKSSDKKKKKRYCDITGKWILSKNFARHKRSKKYERMLKAQTENQN